jgi:ubiquinone/menaquinone biosynthesis C-methylase UbiE
MSSKPKGYVDTTYLHTAAEQLNAVKQLTYERMRVQPGQKVLDVGCGPGTDTIPLAQWVGSSGQVIGVDYDAEMIAEANQRALKAGVSANVTHKHADAIALPYDANYFDACRSERLFIHLLDPAKALSEMTRVTKPGGWIVVFDSDLGNISVDASEIETERRLARVFAEHMVNNGYSGRQLYRLFKQQGLADVSAQVCGFHVTDYALARQVWLLDRVERKALALGVVTVQELDQLRADWERANADGVYFGNGSFILASGYKP